MPPLSGNITVAGRQAGTPNFRQNPDKDHSESHLVPEGSSWIQLQDQIILSHLGTKSQKS